MRLLLPLLALIPLVPATASETPATSQAQAVNIADPNKQVCKKTETTGTRLGLKRVCKTRAEWAAEAEYAKSNLNRNIEQGSASDRSR